MRPWDRHPPWVHWSFFAIWVVAGTLGPIAILDVVLFGHHRHWWVAVALCALWAIDLGIDSLLMRRLQRRDPDRQPWQPPRWKSVTDPSGS